MNAYFPLPGSPAPAADVEVAAGADKVQHLRSGYQYNPYKHEEAKTTTQSQPEQANEDSVKPQEDPAGGAPPAPPQGSVPPGADDV